MRRQPSSSTAEAQGVRGHSVGGLTSYSYLPLPLSVPFLPPCRQVVGPGGWEFEEGCDDRHTMHDSLCNDPNGTARRPWVLQDFATRWALVLEAINARFPAGWQRDSVSRTSSSMDTITPHHISWRFDDLHCKRFHRHCDNTSSPGGSLLGHNTRQYATAHALQVAVFLRTPTPRDFEPVDVMRGGHCKRREPSRDDELKEGRQAEAASMRFAELSKTAILAALVAERAPWVRLLDAYGIARLRADTHLGAAVKRVPSAPVCARRVCARACARGALHVCGAICARPDPLCVCALTHCDRSRRASACSMPWRVPCQGMLTIVFASSVYAACRTAQAARRALAQTRCSFTGLPPPCYDCVHYCLPGMPDLFNGRLLRLVESRLSAASSAAALGEPFVDATAERVLQRWNPWWRGAEPLIQEVTRAKVL